MRLHTLLLSAQDINQVLTQLAGLAAEAAAGEVSCGITVRYDTSLLTVGSSDERAELLDETQYRLGHGPCLQSLETGLIVDCPDFAGEDRWPDYVAAAQELGVRSSLSLPLTMVGESFGAMNVYGLDRPDMFDTATRRELELFAARAAGAIQIATRQIKDAALLGQLEEAMTARSVIDQAIGMIIARHGGTAREAFELLRLESRNSRRRLSDIATDLITATTGEPPDPGRPFIA